MLDRDPGLLIGLVAIMQPSGSMWISGLGLRRCRCSQQGGEGENGGPRKRYQLGGREHRQRRAGVLCPVVWEGAQPVEFYLGAKLIVGSGWVCGRQKNEFRRTLDSVFISF